MLFIVYFLYRKSWAFWVIDKELPKAGQEWKYSVQIFSICSLQIGISTVQKSNYVGCFNFRQWIFAFAHLFPDISMKSIKLHFQSWKKIFSTDFVLFS